MPRSCTASQLHGPAGLGCVGPAAVRRRSCTAQQLHELRQASEEEFQKKVEQLLFVEQLWTVGGKMEAYQGENRVKLTLLEARKMAWEERREALWEEIVRMETELGASHEEEWGYDLTGVLHRMGRS